MSLVKEWFRAAKGTLGDPKSYFSGLDFEGDRERAFKLGLMSMAIGWTLLIVLGLSSSLFLYTIVHPLGFLGEFLMLLLFVYQLMWLGFGAFGPYIAGHSQLAVKRWSDKSKKLTEEVYAECSPIIALFMWIPVVGVLATFYHTYLSSLGLKEAHNLSTRESRMAALTGFTLVNLELLVAVLLGAILAFI